MRGSRPLRPDRPCRMRTHDAMRMPFETCSAMDMADAAGVIIDRVLATQRPPRT